MRLRLPLILLTFGAGLALGACEFQTSSSEPPPPPPVVEAPAAPDVAEDASAAAPEEPEPAQQSAPPPRDNGDMGEARPSEESVQPDSETIFY